MIDPHHNGDSLPRRPESAREFAILAVILVLMAVVFVFDVNTTPDDVTICFIYAVLVFLTLFSRDDAVYLCAAIATALSALGSFINPPTETHSVVFFANRGIAVAAQWIVAFLVTTRKDAERRMQRDFDEQKAKAETSHRFLDILSHEIGTSLTRIDGQAFLLRKNAVEQKPDETAVRADKIRDAVRHINGIVQQIQLGSEAGERAMDMTPAKIDLRALVADAALGAATQDRPIVTEISDLPDHVWGDAGMLRQVLDNVLSNAVKYSQDADAIVVRGACEANAAILSVADRGRGIPADEIDKLFTPYYRARNSRGVHGAGIGLYVAERFVASHGGSIGIASILNEGTTVTIRLPVHPARAEEIHVPATHPLH
jgi:signal transduction histidine kinase